MTEKKNTTVCITTRVKNE